MLRFNVFVLACFLWACSADDNASQQAKKTASVAPQITVKSQTTREFTTKSNYQTQAAISEQPEPDAATLTHADKMLEYHNRIQTMLNKGMQADAVMTGAEIYQSAYRLPRLPKGLRANGIQPPRGLFNDAEAKKITAALQGMDKALVEMLSHYASLEKYVRDDSIRDNGKQGRALVKKIGSAYAQYVGERNSWLGIVDKAASEAESALLYKHPLKRQILTAREMFVQFREVGNLLATGDPERALLEACHQNISNLLVSAGAPPFPAKPALERDYRAFLKQVQVYADVLDRGINEGFHSLQRRELNVAAEASRKAYNNFAGNFNRQDDRQKLLN